MDEITLREKAREALQTGKLPDRRPERMWGGPGSGGHCGICGAAVRPEEHVRCFAAWELERKSHATARLNGRAALSEASADGTIAGCERDNRFSQGSK